MKFMNFQPDIFPALRFRHWGEAINGLASPLEGFDRGRAG